jgi:methylmalonyl-CoA mutase
VLVGVSDFVDPELERAAAVEKDRASGSKQTASSLEPLPARPDAEPFERLRDAASARVAEGHPPRVFLARLGTAADSAPRAGFVCALLAAGGIVPVDAGCFPTEESLVAAWGASGCEVAALCSSDEVYAERALAATLALRAAGATTVVYAGRAGERETELRDAGVDRFLTLGGDALADLGALLAAQEVNLLQETNPQARHLARGSSPNGREPR